MDEQTPYPESFQGAAALQPTAEDLLLSPAAPADAVIVPGDTVPGDTAPEDTPATALSAASALPATPQVSVWRRVGAEIVAGVQTLFSAAIYATLIVTFGFQVARV